MITFDTSQIKRLAAQIGNSPTALKRELNIAVGAAANFGKSQIAKEIGRELATKQKTIKDAIKVQKRIKTHGSTVAAKVIVKYGWRLAIKEFGPRQNKVGVTYKISKREGRKTAPHAFMGPKPGVKNARWGGHAFYREGKERTPIRKLKGASPIGVYRHRNIERVVVAYIKAELKKQVERRIRFNTLKREGKLNWSQFP